MTTMMTTALMMVPTMTKQSNRKRHPAQVAKIVATGVSATSMFAMMTVLGLAGGAEPSSEVAIDPLTLTDATLADQSVPASDPPAAPANDSPAAVATQQVATQQAATPSPAAPTGPVQLTANQVVRVVQAPAAPAAPSAKTRGS